MNFKKLLIVIFGLMFWSTSHAGQDRDISYARQCGELAASYSREECLRTLQEMVNSQKPTVAAKSFAHYSIAALHLGRLKTDNSPSKYSCNGWSEYSIEIDDQRISDQKGRASAEEHLNAVLSDLMNITDSRWASAEYHTQYLSCAYYFLGVIKRHEGKDEESLLYLKKFKEFRKADDLYSPISYEISRFEQEIRERKIKQDRLIKEQEEDRARLAKIAAEEALKSNPEYIRNSAENEIKNLRSIKEKLYAELEEERRIGKISGYVNSKRLHDLGRAIVGIEDEININLKLYKDNGGREKY